MSVSELQERPVETIQPDLLAAANINPRSGLATDYLNHFNEIAMLLELLPQMPECAADVIDWQPASYIEHFRKSNFQGKDLAIAAYGCLDSNLKVAFETVIADIDSTIFDAQALVASGDPANPDVRAKLDTLRSEELLPLLEKANGLIHGVDPAELAFDAGPAEDKEISVQADIDALFD